MFWMGILAFYLAGVFYNLVVMGLLHLQEYKNEIDGLGKIKWLKFIGLCIGSWFLWAGFCLQEIWF